MSTADAPDPVALARVRRLLTSGEARAIRLRAGLSYSEVAAPIGVRRSCISNWESGYRKPSGDAAVQYLRVLDRLSLDTP